MNAQGKRKSLTDDSFHVDSVGKVFAGQPLAYYLWCALFEISDCYLWCALFEISDCYLWCALFEISDCLTSLCGIRDIIYSYIYHHIYFMIKCTTNNVLLANQQRSYQHCPQVKSHLSGSSSLPGHSQLMAEPSNSGGIQAPENFLVQRVKGHVLAPPLINLASSPGPTF